MIHSCTDAKNALLNCLESMSENPWLYSNQVNQFSRKRKISFTDAMLSTSHVLCLCVLNIQGDAGGVNLGLN